MTAAPPGAARQPGCPLCEGPGGRIVARTPQWRIVHADEPGFPAFYRLVWEDHVREFSQLAPADRAACTEALVTLEQAMLRHLRPDKVNLASLGNAVAHLHWHVIARFAWDSHFPGAVWAAPQRRPDAARVEEVARGLATLESELLALAPGPAGNRIAS